MLTDERLWLNTLCGNIVNQSWFYEY